MTFGSKPPTPGEREPAAVLAAAIAGCAVLPGPGN
jgi:hypothetical protein